MCINIYQVMLCCEQRRSNVGGLFVCKRQEPNSCSGCCFTGQMCRQFLMCLSMLFILEGYLKQRSKAIFLFFFFQGLLTLICLLSGNIIALIEFASFLVWMFYGISMAALLVMRFTKRDVKRPFKVNTSLYCRINDINAIYHLYGDAKRIFSNVLLWTLQGYIHIHTCIWGNYY